MVKKESVISFAHNFHCSLPGVEWRIVLLKQHLKGRRSLPKSIWLNITAINMIL